jgi:hypothetical protein
MSSVSVNWSSGCRFLGFEHVAFVANRAVYGIVREDAMA